MTDNGQTQDRQTAKAKAHLDGERSGHLQAHRLGVAFGRADRHGDKENGDRNESSLNGTEGEHYEARSIKAPDESDRA